MIEVYLGFFYIQFDIYCHGGGFGSDVRMLVCRGRLLGFPTEAPLACINADDVLWFDRWIQCELDECTTITCIRIDLSLLDAESAD